jgi:hypothetical protein
MIKRLKILLVFDYFGFKIIDDKFVVFRLGSKNSFHDKIIIIFYKYTYDKGRNFNEF